MRLSVQEMLDEVKTTEAAEVNTSFLDEFRRTGVVPQHETEDPGPGTAPNHTPEPEDVDSAVPEDTLRSSTGEVDEHGWGDQLRTEERINESEAVHSGTKVGRGPGGSSRSTSGGTSTAPDPQSTAAPPSPPAQDHAEGAASDSSDQSGIQALDFALDAEDRQRRAEDAARDISANRKSDQRDAIQGAGVKGGVSEPPSALPESGFRLPAIESQPMVRNLPRLLLDAMREQWRSSAVRERGVSDVAAKAFSQRLSQPALVISFLLAHLDVHIDTDPATQTAAELFRSRDPLLGSVVERMSVLERHERNQDAQLERLQGMLAEVRNTSAVIEQAVAYSIADKTENFLRGSHNIREAPIAHKDAIFIRDKAREATEKQAKFERERNGRPIR